MHLKEMLVIDGILINRVRKVFKLALDVNNHYVKDMLFLDSIPFNYFMNSTINCFNGLRLIFA